MKRCLMAVLVAAMIGGLVHAESPAPGTFAHYRVLPGGHRSHQPFNVVNITYGPAEAGRVTWQLEAIPEEDPNSRPLFQLRAATSRDPLAVSSKPLEFYRYQLHIPETGETYDYRDVRRPGYASLPGWGRFVHHFIPRPARATGYQGGVPHTCEYLGHVLTLREARGGAAWSEWSDATVLNLDRELWIGTGRTFKDREGHRLPQTPERRNYDYVTWTQDDYEVMIDAGMNVLGVAPGMKGFLQGQPVFYRGGTNDLVYPVDLYRSNFIGPKMYMDEPACIMVGNQTVHTTLKYFTDAAALLTNRVRAQEWEGRWEVHEGLRKRDVGLGDMKVIQRDYATWETRYETAFYQFQGGAKGFVHEGRYQLDEFNEFARASTGIDREYSAEEMFRYYFGVMRGAARHFGGDWGTSIYGQADPRLSPTAVKLAWDMGARYVWFWTSDHDHHLPWHEQNELTRIVRKHAAENPRPSIRGPKPLLDKVIVIPYGYFLVLESPSSRKNAWDLWWVRELDPEGRNESSQRYRRLMHNALVEINKALDAGESFDVTVDDGTEITGYREVVRVGTD